MLAKLETKIPPPVVLLACGVLAWGLARIGRPLDWPFQGVLVAMFVLAGLALNLVPKRAFDRAATTINPLQPERTSTLVTTGLYRWTRNPMYLGQTLLLVAWALWLDRGAAFLAVPAFVAYITRFQIQPEELILSRRFPGVYASFCEQTRRWI